jgi:hypothetical protein
VRTAAGVRLKVTQGGGTVVYGQMRKRTFDLIVGRALGREVRRPAQQRGQLDLQPG